MSAPLSEKATVTDLSVWRQASYRERRKQAKAMQKELYEKPEGGELWGDIYTTRKNLLRLATRLAVGTVSGIPAAQLLSKLDLDLGRISSRVDGLENKFRKARKKLKRMG